MMHGQANIKGKLLSIEDSVLKSDKKWILNCLFLFLQECGNVSQSFLINILGLRKIL